MSRFIDADATIELFKSGLPKCKNCDKTIPCVECIIHEAPTVDVQLVVHSRWEISSDGYYPYCKNCNAKPEIGKMTKYCAECGARMDGEKHE